LRARDRIAVRPGLNSVPGMEQNRALRAIGIEAEAISGRKRRSRWTSPFLTLRAPSEHIRRPTCARTQQNPPISATPSRAPGWARPLLAAAKLAEVTDLAAGVLSSFAKSARSAHSDDGRPARWITGGKAVERILLDLVGIRFAKALVRECVRRAEIFCGHLRKPNHEWAL
jgi:hypothetical protein